VRVLLLSTYELGHQPLHLASAGAALTAAGHEVRATDLSVEDLAPDDLAWAQVAAVAVPMHTATRLAAGVASRLRQKRPDLPLCAFGLYAAAAPGFDAAVAGEYEDPLVEWVGSLRPGVRVELGRHRQPQPDRRGLAALDRYARLVHAGVETPAGYVEASRGCSHRCRHCPVPVVYDGRIRTVPVSTVVADVDAQVEQGAAHITFGDPDFLNGPHHSMRVLDAVHSRHPALTFDVTVKVEHVLRHRGLIGPMAAAGVLFAVSAFESVDDDLLGRLDKGHTAADAAGATALLRTQGIEVRPSWLPFTPWTTVADIVALLDFVVAQDLVANVDPVQYTIRLLLPPGSLLLADPDLGPHLGPFDPESLGYPWRSPHPEVDELQARLAGLVERHAGANPTEMFPGVRETVATAARSVGVAEPVPAPPDSGRRPPRLSEPWFCCAEPTGRQIHGGVLS